MLQETREILSGETDWKIVAIDAHDPRANQLNSMALIIIEFFQTYETAAEDIEKAFPGKLKEIFEFLRDYKIPDGKPANKFGFNNSFLNKVNIKEIITTNCFVN